MPTNQKIIVVVVVACVVLVYALELLFVSILAYNKFRNKNSKNIFRRKPAVCVHLLAVIGIICFFYGYFIEPYRIEINTVTIQTEKLNHATFRVVQISDLHCDIKVRNEKVLPVLINSLKPDVIVFTGDSINTSKALALFKDTLKSLNAELDKLAVRGNFDVDYWYNLDLFGDTGFKVLDEETVTLQKDNEKIYISGLSCKYPSHAAGLLTDIPEERFSIFLYHYPGLVENLKNLNVDLYLCGHTHGGQVALPFYGALVTASKFGKKYESGLYTVGRITMYVNRGIGMEGGLAPRVRFCARPEITVFEIKPAKR